MTQISFSQKVIIEDELEVQQGTTTRSLTIEDDDNPFLALKVDNQTAYKILYNDFGNELVILNENSEEVFKINGDKVYIPGLYGNFTRQVMVDTSGLLHVPPFSKQITFAQLQKEENNQNYKTHFYGYDLPEGVTLNLLKVKVGDWNSGVDSLSNSVRVELRRAPLNNVGPAETIFKIQTNTLHQNNTFEEINTNEVLIPFSNIVYNDEFVYYLLVYTCQNCAFRAAVLEE